MSKFEIMQEIEKLENKRDNAKNSQEYLNYDYEIGLMRMKLNPERYYPVI